MMLQTANRESFGGSTLLLKSLTGSSRRPNLLLVLGEDAPDAVVRHLSRWCRKPFSCSAFPGSLRLPFDRSGTFLLHGVESMTLAQQIALYDWLNGPDVGPQVISMTRSALEPLVMTGHFLEGLLRRLSVVQLDLA